MSSVICVRNRTRQGSIPTGSKVTMDKKTGESQQIDNQRQSQLAEVVERNIGALLARRRMEAEKKGLEEKLADGITRFAGSMAFVYLHLVVFGVWIAANLGWLPFLPRFDPSFVVLAMFASVEAIFLSTFVLITQNRMAAIADKRADLDLQISLLGEHEITRVIKLVSLMAKKMEIDASYDPELNELMQDVRPEKVLDTIEEHDKKSPEDL